MIIREAGEELILIDQHTHAAISGDLGTSWAFETHHFSRERKTSLRTAAELHDIGWLALDNEPAWNSESERPYSFLDFPLERKLPAYKQGVDQVAEIDPYAALLCSRHYESFFPNNPSDALTESFVEAERSRQGELQGSIQPVDPMEFHRQLEFDLGLLKLWDNLSLYLCLNTPGAANIAEHPWYQGGFIPTATQLDGPKIRFQAAWQDERRISLAPFPLTTELTVSLKFRTIPLQDLEVRSWPKRLEGTVNQQTNFVWITA